MFDYIYYRIHKFYLGFNESGPWAFGIPAMAMTQYFFLTTLDKISYMLGTNLYFLIGKREYVIIFAIVTINFVRYFWLVPYSKLYERWKTENSQQSILRGGLVLLYIFGSLFCGLYFTGFFNRI